MQPGDEWVYRLRDSAPSERVRILETTKNRHNVRATIEHLDGEDAGRTETVPGARLRAPWAEVAEFDELMANWARLDTECMTETETYATEAVFGLLVPSAVATIEWSPVRHALAIYDTGALAELIASPLGTIQEDSEWFQHGDALMMSPEGTTLVSAALCRAHTAAVLEHVLEDEKAARELCITGFTGRIIKGKPIFVDTDDAWRSYREGKRPVHELLREWCGHRAVTAHKRMAATEGEVQRLDRLLDRTFRELDEAGLDYIADELRSEHLEERITPATLRPLVERLVEPEVQFISTRRRRWWA